MMRKPEKEHTVRCKLISRTGDRCSVVRSGRMKVIPYGSNESPVRYGACKFPASQLKYRTVFQIEVPYGSAKMFPYGSNMSPVRYIAMQFFPVAIEIPYGV